MRCPDETPVNIDRRCWHRLSWRSNMNRQPGMMTPAPLTILQRPLSH